MPGQGEGRRNTVSYTRKLRVKQIVLAWDDETGIFKGGHVDWMETFTNDDDGTVRRGRDIRAEPIIGGVQPDGLALTDLLGTIEAQRVMSDNALVRERNGLAADKVRLENELKLLKP